jgi:hypothetical protein
MLSSRARRKGYPGYIAALGVLGWSIAETSGIALGARFGVPIALLLGFGLGILGACSAFVVIDLLPDRAKIDVNELEETFR